VRSALLLFDASLDRLGDSWKIAVQELDAFIGEYIRSKRIPAAIDPPED
jgi:hypothetical protein